VAVNPCSFEAGGMRKLAPGGAGGRGGGGGARKDTGYDSLQRKSGGKTKITLPTRPAFFVKDKERVGKPERARRPSTRPFPYMYRKMTGPRGNPRLVFRVPGLAPYGGGVGIKGRDGRA